MKIALAQIKSKKGAILGNIQNHKNWIKQAVSLGANAIFFPELSITSYEPELANTLSTTLNDKRFDQFQEISNTQNITIGIGMPLHADKGIQIAMVIFQPHQPRIRYAKQILHEDECPYFVCGTEQLILDLNGIKIAPAICYESLQPKHLEDAVKQAADLYIACVAKSQSGIIKANKYYPIAAKKHSIPILLSNCIGFCDNFQSVGQSAIWDKNGALVAHLTANKEGLLVYDWDTQRVAKI